MQVIAINIVVLCVVIKINPTQQIENDFSQLVNRVSFIDKSLLIKDLFEHEMVLLTAPAGYGKTTNLDMVKRFFEIEVDENGKRVPAYATDNYELFKRRELKITKYPYDLFFQEHSGKHPVLHIDYTELCNVTDFESMLSTFREIVYRTFLPHRYILKNVKLDWFEEGAREQFSRYSDGLEYKKLSEENITRGFFILSKILCEHFSKRVFVLIDEYNAYLKCLREKEIADADRIIDFVRFINDDLINFNAFIDHAFLTGIPLRNDSDVWPVNIAKFRFLEKHKFSRYFGVLENEVGKSLKRNFFKEDEIEKVKLNLLRNHDGLSVDDENVYSFRNYTSVLKNMKHGT